MDKGAQDPPSDWGWFRWSSVVSNARIAFVHIYHPVAFHVTRGPDLRKTKKLKLHSWAEHGIISKRDVTKSIF